jgi:hypothetical protein
VLAAVMAAAAEKKTVERERHPWNERSSCAEING